MNMLNKILQNFKTGIFGFLALFIGYFIIMMGKYTNDLNLMFLGSIYLIICQFLTIYVIEDYKNNLTSETNKENK